MKLLEMLKDLKLLCLVLILFFSSTKSSFSQSYFKLLGNGQSWEQFIGDPTTICTWTSGKLVFEGADTLIQGTFYTKLVYYPIYSNNVNGWFCPPYFNNDSITLQSSFVREDTIQKKVYLLNTIQNTEYLLYDFSLIDGDTLFNPYDSFNSPYWIIDSVRPSNLINKNCFYVHPFLGGLSPEYYYIEGIGGKYGIDEQGTIAIGEIKRLFCVKDSMYNTIYGGCWTNVSLNENLAQKKIKLEFDKTQNKFSLTGTDKYQNYSVTIYNTYGQLLYENNSVFSSQQYSLKISEQYQGILIYKISLKNTMLSSGKITVDN